MVSWMFGHEIINKVHIARVSPATVHELMYLYQIVLLCHLA